ncbi:MAG: DUF2334 domain-containing protein [Candidatus Aminicenantes bacterium]|nr:DUF2334 domain-containing protein [Candidatus Aminicenantes bacterium]
MIKRKRPALVISLHDVSPVFFSQLEFIFNQLKELGVPFFVLKVIPDFQGKNKITLFPSFTSWLKELSANGSEIVLHGLTHTRPSLDLRTQSLTKKWLTGGEDEFSHLSPDEARRRIEEGLEILKEAGLKCFGFTAPTWRLSQSTIRVLQEANLRYFTTLTQVVDLKRDRHFFSPALGHQGIHRFLESLMGWGNELSRIFLIPWLNLIRVVFHPRQLDHPNLKKSIELVKRLLSYAQPITYFQFLEK